MPHHPQPSIASMCAAEMLRCALLVGARQLARANFQTRLDHIHAGWEPMEYLSKLEESALAKFDRGDFNGAISDLSKVRSVSCYDDMVLM